MSKKNYVLPNGEMPFVTEDDDGIRPAGKPDECFYCKQKVGERHKSDCATVVKKVLLKVTVILEEEVPYHWGEEMINFRYNESSWCADNLRNMLDETIEKLNNKGGCLCPYTEIEYLRDGEIGDEQPYC